MEPEIGGQIDDHPDTWMELGDQVLGLAVGKGQKDHVQPVQLRHLGGRIGQARVSRGQARGVRGHRLALMSAGGRDGDLEPGVSRTEAHQFDAGVPGGSHNADLHRAPAVSTVSPAAALPFWVSGFILQVYAYFSIIIRIQAATSPGSADRATLTGPVLLGTVDGSA